MDRRVEVRVIANRGGEEHGAVGLLEEMALGRASFQGFHPFAAQIAALRCGERAVSVEGLPGADRKNLIADGDSDVGTCPAPRSKHSQWQVLDREVASGHVCRFHPAAPFRIVRLVDHRSPSPSRSWIGSSNEQEPKAWADRKSVV